MDLMGVWKGGGKNDAKGVLKDGLATTCDEGEKVLRGGRPEVVFWMCYILDVN